MCDSCFTAEQLKQQNQYQDCKTFMYIFALKGNKISYHNQFSAYLNNHRKNTQEKEEKPGPPPIQLIFIVLANSLLYVSKMLHSSSVQKINECLRNVKRRHTWNNKKRSKEAMENFWKRILVEGRDDNWKQNQKPHHTSS